MQQDDERPVLGAHLRVVQGDPVEMRDAEARIFHAGLHLFSVLRGFPCVRPHSSAEHGEVGAASL